MPLPWTSHCVPFERRHHYIFEVLPVPSAVLERHWYDIDITCRKHFRRHKKECADPRQKEYDTQALYTRALAGIDVVWVVARFDADASEYLGVIVTTIADRPPTKRKVFRRERSITIHLVNGNMIESWMAQAVERITAYAHDNGCRQAFLLARWRWQRYAAAFVGHFDRVGFSRDRQTTRGGNHWSNRIGWFRELVPFEPRRVRPQHLAYSRGAKYVSQ